MSRLAYFPLVLLVCKFGFAAPATPVILISVDTLRADYLSCYQPTRRPTPHIDALAKGGTLFSDASTPFPLTLPAHTSLLSSTYPFANGVEDNGVPLKAGVDTLATILKSAGYRTGAFVASFVLDRRFGLSRGFDTYDGPADLHNDTTGGHVERKRPGAQVADAAMRWLDRNSGAPYFLFLHLYDLHLPYDRPLDPSLRTGETGYSAELAYEDRVIGDFITYLQRKGLFDKSLIVFTSDHGEGLGDHGESTHGYFVYQSTLHVPLLVHWPVGFTRSSPTRVDEPASLLDVAPTVLDAIGVARPAAMRGRSLLAALSAADVYSESVYARNHFGCATLRSLRAGRYHYIEAPKPELYDLAADPKELRNLYEREKQRAIAMAQRIAAIRAAAPVSGKPAAPTSDAAKKLRSLGYASGGGSPAATESRVDPKDRAADFEKYVTAVSLSNSGKLAEADRHLRALRDKYPELAEIHLSLGLNEQRLRQFGEAAKEFQQASRQAPSDAGAHLELGFCYFHLGRLDEAVQELNAALALEPWNSRADEGLAEIYIQKKDFAQARARLNHLLSIDPNSYPANYNLGIFAALEQNWNEAEQRLQSAVRADPKSAEAHDALGRVYLQQGKTEQATREMRAAEAAGAQRGAGRKP